MSSLETFLRGAISLWSLGTSPCANGEYLCLLHNRTHAMICDVEAFLQMPDFAPDIYSYRLLNSCEAKTKPLI
jgi:hypothetical protein